MTDRTLTADANPETGDATISESGEPPFDLEPSEPGVVPARVIDELRRCYREVKDYTQALADAVKAQAEKHGIEPGALRKYIAALEGDKTDQVSKEIEDLRRLIEEGGAE
jgi:hypothetical protein